MAGRLFQSIIYQMQSTLRCKAGVTDDEGMVIACTDVSEVGKPLGVSMDAPEMSEIKKSDGYCFKRIGARTRSEFIVFCQGTDETAEALCGVLAVSLTQIKQFYDEKYDKLSFIKNILTDNILTGDVYIKAKSLHLAVDVPRAAFVIRSQADDYIALELTSGLFPDKNKDFVVSLSEKDVVLVKDISEDSSPKALDKIAHTIVDTLSSEMMEKVQVGIGSAAPSITEIAHSYKDACVALEVAKVFDQEKSIISYNNLGIARLIYQLPTKLCEMFLTEIFKKSSLDVLDEETIVTIQKFFENNLNVSEASRQLFVHRNTLVYRLDKIHKLTGLDLRKFDDAIVFKVAMMVSRYLKSDKFH